MAQQVLQNWSAKYIIFAYQKFDYSISLYNPLFLFYIIECPYYVYIASTYMIGTWL